MNTTSVEERIPYGVGRLTAGWWSLIGILIAITALGLYAYVLQRIQGDVVTGMRDIGTGGGAVWGLYAVFVVYFMGISFAGITIATLIRLMNLEQLRAVSRMAELLTVVALILGIFSILADVGRPGRAIINLLLYARLQSPLFFTMSLVISGYLSASLVYLYLDGRRDAALCAQRPGGLQWLYRLWAAGYRDTPEERERHDRTSRWLARAIVPLLVIGTSTLGFVFGGQGGRPGWLSTLQAPAFVVLAGVSGIGLLIIIAALVRHVLGLREQLNLEVFRWLGNFLCVLTITYLYFLLVEALTATYAGGVHEAAVTSSLLRGQYAGLFWFSVWLLVIPFVVLLAQFLIGRHSIPLIVLAGVLVNIAAIGKRYLIVVPSQTHGTVLPYLPGSYSATWVEYAVVVGLFALGMLFYIVFMKLFPIMEISERTHGGA
jgi:molybdopterin-containing oxidoreductase family membrane subunit